MKFAILDVDDVLLRTGRASRTAAAGIHVPLLPFISQHDAERVRDAFERHLETLLSRLQGIGEPHPDYLELRPRLERLQLQITSSGCDIKEWSRHCLLACAFADCGIRPTRSLIDTAADHYWMTLEKHAKPYSDAHSFIDELRTRGFHLHLATNSDGFLQFDDASGQFEYEPTLARARKLERLSALWTMGFDASNVTIGDPIGKSHPAFFRRVLSDFSDTVGRDVDLSATFALGDSLHSDVVPFIELGVQFGIWLCRREPPPSSDLPNKVIRVSNLEWNEVSSLMSAAEP